MGEKGVRAVALCKPEIVEALNRRFVPAVFDNLTGRDLPDPDFHDPGLSTTPPHEVQALFDRLKARYTRLPPKQENPQLVQAYLLTLDGRLLEEPDGVMVPRPDEVIERLLRQLPATGREGPSPPPHLGRLARPLQPGHLRLRVVTRYRRPLTLEVATRLLPETRRLGTFSPWATVGPALNAPTLDQVSLRPHEAARLLPPAEARPGLRYAPPREALEPTFLRLLDAASPFWSEQAGIRECEVQATLVNLEEEQARVELEARFEADNPGVQGRVRGLQPGAPGYDPPNRVSQTLRGFMVYDPRTRTISDLQWATVEARHQGPDGLSVEFDAVAWLDRGPASGPP